MVKINDNYLKLPGSYLFSTIGKKVREYSGSHPDKKIIRLGIGDVTLPLAPAIISALHSAVDEMGRAETFRGYAPDLGYDFLREAIAEHDYRARGCAIGAEEWVDYACKVGAVILYDAAYEAYITEDDVPHSIYECDGAKSCAIELRSFSKNAGFTGLRLGFAVVPKELERGGVSLHALWARRHGTKYNGAPYIVQRAGEAVYSQAGKAQLAEQIAYYRKNADYIYKGLKEAGYTVSGGGNSPYIWLKTPKGMSSWEFFDCLLEKANVVGTPGSGFGPSGEGYFRLTAFGSYENTVEAVDRIRAL